MHEFSSWSNDIGVKSAISGIFVIKFNSIRCPFILDRCHSLCLFLYIKSSSISSRPLLIHFSSWRNSINRHIQSFIWLHNWNNAINILKYQKVHFLLILRSRFINWMATRMNDSIHIQIQVIYAWIIFSNFLLNQNLRIYITLIILWRINHILFPPFILFNILCSELFQVIFTQGIKYKLRVSHCEPFKECGHSHFYSNKK